MSDWEEKELGKICENNDGIIRTGPFGSQLHKSDYQETGIPVVMPKDLDEQGVNISTIARVGKDHVERLSQHKLKRGDIVYARRGDIGKRALITEREEGWLCGTGCLKLNPGNGELDSKYLFYYLGDSQVTEWIYNQAVGATMANLNTGILSSVKINYPKLVTQQKIASILSAFDELIENNTRRISILEETARLIYREWFVHYRYPGHENDRLVDSGTELGDVPEGWEVKKLLDVCELQTGKALKSKQFNENGIGTKAVRIRNVNTNSSTTFTDEKFDEKYVVKNGDILVGMDGEFHMCRWADGKSVLVQRVARFRPKKEFELSKYFYFWAIKKPIDFFNRTITGTTVAHLGKKHIETIEVVLPPKEMWNEINQLLDPLYEQELILRKKNKKLKETRDVLLPKLISGKIEINDIALN